MTPPQFFKIPNFSERDRAIFETGIKLGALFHQFCGAPISNNKETMEKIKEGIKASISCQPFVKRVEINFDFGNKNENHFTKTHEYDYTTISGKNLKAEVEIGYNNWSVLGCVEWVDELKYPLMYIKEIKETAINQINPEL